MEFPSQFNNEIVLGESIQKANDMMQKEEEPPSINTIRYDAYKSTSPSKLIKATKVLVSNMEKQSSLSSVDPNLVLVMNLITLLTLNYCYNQVLAANFQRHL